MLVLALVAAGVAAVLTAFAACSSAPPEGGGETLDEAEARARKLLDSTVAEVASDQKVEPRSYPDTTCTDELGAPADTVQRSYGVRIEFDPKVDLDDVVQRVIAHWEGEGADPEPHRIEFDFPTVRGELEGNIFEFFVNREHRFATLEGSTPCLAAED